MKSIQLMKTILGLLVLINIISCSDDVRRTIMDSFNNAPKKEMFKVFHFLFEKEYDLNSEEAIRKYRIFKSNMKIIEETNSQDLSYKFGINQFTDLSPEEFKSMYLMDPDVKKTLTSDLVKNLRSEEGSADYFDLNADREQGEQEIPQSNEKINQINQRPYPAVDHTSFLLAPRHQQSCSGGGWSFAMTAAVEALYAQKTRVREYLSVQQLMECNPFKWSCFGGNALAVRDYVKLYGLMLEVDYPFTATTKNVCKYSTSKTIKKINTFTYCSNYSDRKCSTDFVYSQLRYFPLAVGVDATALQFYRNGIFNGSCKNDNHGVLLVGYGVQSNEQFWVLRNSWGVGWGEYGHFRVARNDSTNSCFITNEALAVTS